MYVPGDEGVKRMESSSVPRPGHHDFMEPVLHDSPVRRLLWSCSAIVVWSIAVTVAFEELINRCYEKPDV